MPFRDFFKFLSPDNEAHGAKETPKKTTPRDRLVSGLSLFQKTTGKKLELDLTQGLNEATLQQLKEDLHAEAVSLFDSRTFSIIDGIDTEDSVHGAFEGISLDDSEALRKADIARAYVRAKLAINAMQTTTVSPTLLQNQSPESKPEPLRSREKRTPKELQEEFYQKINDDVTEFFKLIKKLPEFGVLQARITPTAQALLEAVQRIHPSRPVPSADRLNQIALLSEELLRQVAEEAPRVVINDIDIEKNQYTETEELVGIKNTIIKSQVSRYKKELSL